MELSTKNFIVFVFYFAMVMSGKSQTNESPTGAYEWKRGKTELQTGYVVLKSGKRMDGKISLIGSATQVTEVAYEGGGKEIKFPIGSLQSYGLVGVNPNAIATVSSGPLNESPESMYEWRNMGVVMNKVITSSTPRAGYVVLQNGTKYEGELKLRRKDDVLEDIEVKTVSGKEKFETAEVARYGYTVSQDEVAQANLAKQSKSAFKGTVTTLTGMLSGEITIIPVEGKRYYEQIIFKGSDGKFVDYTTKTISGFTYTSNRGREVKYVVIDDKLVVEQFQGKTFQVYLNPNPTTINEFATSLVKGAVSVGTSVAASAAVKRDAKKNGYETNMDSVIRVSSTEDLKILRDQMASLAGYESAEDAINNSDNESLKTNLSALEIAIQGREVANTTGGILNEEWIIFNNLTREKTIVYKSKYKTQIDVLLMGCDKYFELTKPLQNDLQKWDNLTKAMQLLDSCY